MQVTQFKTSKRMFHRVVEISLRRFIEKLPSALFAAGHDALLFLLLCASFTYSVSGQVSGQICLSVTNEHVTSITNAPGQLNYSFGLQNNTGVPVNYLYLAPTTNCFTVVPGIFTFNPPLQTGQTSNVSVMITLTGNCGTNLCLLMSLHDSKLVKCCSREVCFRVPSILPLILPSIVLQPASLIVTQGATATFSVTATGTPPLTYLWRFNNTNIPGATNTTYAIFNAQSNNAGIYDVVVSNTSGSATSAPARLIVKNNFFIGQNPDGTLTISWPPGEGWILQEASSVFGPWSSSASQGSPVKLTPSRANRFYRLVKP